MLFCLDFGLRSYAFDAIFFLFQYSYLLFWLNYTVYNLNLYNHLSRSLECLFLYSEYQGWNVRVHEIHLRWIFALHFPLMRLKFMKIKYFIPHFCYEKEYFILVNLIFIQYKIIPSMLNSFKSESSSLCVEVLLTTRVTSTNWSSLKSLLSPCDRKNWYMKMKQLITHNRIK